MALKVPGPIWRQIQEGYVTRSWILAATGIGYDAFTRVVQDGEIRVIRDRYRRTRYCIDDVEQQFGVPLSAAHNWDSAVVFRECTRGQKRLLVTAEQDRAADVFVCALLPPPRKVPCVRRRRRKDIGPAAWLK